MYAKFLGGTKAPGGYVVPCDVINEVKDEHGGVCGAYVRLTDPKGDHSWCQYIDVSQLINDDEAESG